MKALTRTLLAGAWVLWAQEYNATGGILSPWDIVAAYPAVDACVHRLDVFEQSFSEDGFHTHRFAPTTLDRDRKGINPSITWRCLPESLDPRGSR